MFDITLSFLFLSICLFFICLPLVISTSTSSHFHVFLCSSHFYPYLYLSLIPLLNAMCGVCVQCVRVFSVFGVLCVLWLGCACSRVRGCGCGPVCTFKTLPCVLSKRSRVFSKTPMSHKKKPAVSPSLSLSLPLPSSLFSCVSVSSHPFSYVPVSSVSLSLSCQLFNDDDNAHSSGWLSLYTRL